MAITFFATASAPADNSTLLDAGPGDASIAPPASMVTGDLVVLFVYRKNLHDITISVTGGQTWDIGTLRQTGSAAGKVFWCRFNGTWTANPAIATDSSSNVITLLMEVYRPSSGSNTWALDTAETWHTYNGLVSPFDVQATGNTAVAASTVTVCRYSADHACTWGGQTAGWANPGNAQYRNLDTAPTNKRPTSISSLYKILSAPGATGNPVNRQLTLTGANGLWITNTFKEQSAAVTVSAVGDGLFHDGETGIVITGTGFGASHTGSADVIFSPSSSDPAAAGAVTQTQTAWSATSATVTAALSTLPYFTDWFAFVKNSSGQFNSVGFPIQREAWMNLSATLENLAGTPQANLSNIRYRVCAGTINGTVIQSGTNATSDGSGVIALPTVVLTDGGALAPGDDVWVELALNGVSQAVSYAFNAIVTPNYS